MKKIKEYFGIILIVLVVLGLSFYWFEIRLVGIRKGCIGISLADAKNTLKKRAEADKKYEAAANNNWYLKEDFELSYKNCLRQNGLRE